MARVQKTRANPKESDFILCPHAGQALPFLLGQEKEAKESRKKDAVWLFIATFSYVARLFFHPRSSIFRS